MGNKNLKRRGAKAPADGQGDSKIEAPAEKQGDSKIEAQQKTGKAAELSNERFLKLSNNKRFDGKFQLIADLDNEKILVPLKKVSISCECRGPTAATNVELTYVNTNEESPMECEYIFPIDKSTILAKFEASIDGKTIMTNVKEKEQA